MVASVNTQTCDVTELHYKDPAANSDKFYRTFVFGRVCYVQYGRRGTEGQWQTKAFPSEYAAQEFAAKQVRSKMGKGYAQTRTATFDAPATARIDDLQRLFFANASGASPTGPTLNETNKAIRAKEDAEAEKFRQQLVAMRQGLDSKTQDAPIGPPADSLEAKLAAALDQAKSKAQA